MLDLRVPIATSGPVFISAAHHLASSSGPLDGGRSWRPCLDYRFTATLSSPFHARPFHTAHALLLRVWFIPIDGPGKVPHRSEAVEYGEILGDLDSM